MNSPSTTKSVEFNPVFLLSAALTGPGRAFQSLASSNPSWERMFFGGSLWLLLLPPLFSWIGATNFGWRLGADQPLRLESGTLTLISLCYFALLVFGLFSTAWLSWWMASTYGAERSFGTHLALITLIGEPLALASVAHLFPDVFFNILVLIPAMIWSMYLLFKGIPLSLQIPPERGVLMASSLVGWLLVAAVSLLGLSMALWTLGIGPLLGV